MPLNSDWTNDELLAALDLYCRTPFGRQDARNPDVIALANVIGRTPGAVSYRLNNFSSVDPKEQQRGIKGASHGSKAGEELFLRFLAEPDAVALEMAEALKRLGSGVPARMPDEWEAPPGPSETLSHTRVRLLQSFFRRSVISAYEHRCAMCDVDIAALLNAAHIIPWAQAEGRRADPRNGLALCALHDRAFDRGMLTITDDYRIAVVIHRIGSTASTVVSKMLLSLDGQAVYVPKRFAADPSALAHHRKRAESAE